MTIAIVSIVTPKMRPPEARELTGDERYVKFLVGMLDESLSGFLSCIYFHSSCRASKQYTWSASRNFIIYFEIHAKRFVESYR